MGRVFETRFSRGRTFGEDDYPSFWTAIRATKNEMKNTLRGCKWPPNDDETHIKQPEDSVGDGGRFYYEMRPRRNIWRGAISPRLGRRMRQQKNQTIELIMVFGGD